MNNFYEKGRAVLFSRPIYKSRYLSGFRKSGVVTLLICIFSFHFVCFAQNSGESGMTGKEEVKPLQIGDTIPEELWNMPLQVVNHPDGKEVITLNDYRDKKLIILDFWATWCSACLKPFPLINRIQDQFEEELKILLVNTEVNKESEFVGDFLKDYSIKRNTSFLQTSIVKDTILRQLIPFNLIPHYTWINNEGVIVAATSAEDVEPETISDFLNGKVPRLSLKADRIDFDSKEPFLFNRKVVDSESFKFGSALSGRMKGLSTMSSFSVKLSDPLTRVFMINTSALNMILKAFQQEGHFNTNRIVLNINDPSRFIKSSNKSNKDTEWDKDNLFCYELFLSAQSKEEVYQKLKEDILGYFGVEVKIEDRELECWVVKTNNKVIEAITKEGRKKQVDNLIVPKSVQQITNYLDYMLPIPVTNGSSYQGDVIVEMPEDLTNITHLLSTLRNAGLILEKCKRTFPVFVVSEL